MEDVGHLNNNDQLKGRPSRNYEYHGKIPREGSFAIYNDELGNNIDGNFSDNLFSLSQYYDKLIQSDSGNIGLVVKKRRHLAIIASSQESEDLADLRVGEYYHNIIDLCTKEDMIEENLDIHVLSTYVGLIYRHMKRGRRDEAKKCIDIFRGYETTNIEVQRFINSLSRSLTLDQVVDYVSSDPATVKKSPF